MKRKAAVAGSFYPNDPLELQSLIKNQLNQAEEYHQKPIALIAPHAGYIYSGPIAANAYRSLQKYQNDIKHIVLLGPAHRVGFMGLALSSADYFSTPLGDIPINEELEKKLHRFKQVNVFDEAHREEHSLEVHLPFLQTVLPHFDLLPIVVGQAGIEEVAQVLRLCLKEPQTLVIISSDMSHYLDYNSAQHLDSHTAHAILENDNDGLSPELACGFYPLRGLLKVAKEESWKAKLLDLRNSGDTAGSHDHVVGYSAFAFFKE